MQKQEDSLKKSLRGTVINDSTNNFLVPQNSRYFVFFSGLKSVKFFHEHLTEMEKKTIQRRNQPNLKISNNLVLNKTIHTWETLLHTAQYPHDRIKAQSIKSTEQKQSK